jgi:hypothetical protein
MEGRVRITVALVFLSGLSIAGVTLRPDGGAAHRMPAINVNRYDSGDGTLSFGRRGPKRRASHPASLAASPSIAVARTGGGMPADRGFELDNGVIRIRMNDIAPIITQMWVGGTPAVVHDNIGADFQMTARSAKGDGYNPTQGGDCSGMPSLLRQAVAHWNAVDPATSASQGVLLDIVPRNYNEPSYPGCLGPGELLPYDMRFGVTLGDDRQMPRELMLVDMSIQKNAGSSAEDIVKGLSELPVMYLDNTTFRYAYFSTDNTPLDGETFQPMRVATSSGYTHDTQRWPSLTNFQVGQDAHVIMLCDRDDAAVNTGSGRCVAIYSHEGVLMQASRRDGAIHSLTMIAAIQKDADAPLISDFDLHTQRRLIVVGNPDTVASGIAWAETWLDKAGWRRW